MNNPALTPAHIVTMCYREVDQSSHIYAPDWSFKAHFREAILLTSFGVPGPIDIASS